MLPEWINRNLAGNAFTANGDNPLNLVSHARGSLHLELSSPSIEYEVKKTDWPFLAECGEWKPTNPQTVSRETESNSRGPKESFKAWGGGFHIPH